MNEKWEMPERLPKWKEGLDKRTRWKIHRCGWDNRFAMPMEIGLYWNFTMGGIPHRPIGCPGLDDDPFLTPEGIHLRVLL